MPKEAISRNRGASSVKQGDKTDKGRSSASSSVQKKSKQKQQTQSSSVKHLFGREKPIVTQSVSNQSVQLQQLCENDIIAQICQTDHQGAVKSVNALEKQHQKDHRVPDATSNNMSKQTSGDINQEEGVMEALMKKLSDSQQQGGPQVMDLRLVIEMFKDIKNDLRTNNDKIDGIAATQTLMSSEVTTLKSEVSFYKKKSEVMSGTIQNMAHSVNTLEKRVSKLETNLKHPSVMISGLKTSHKKQEAKVQVEAFLQDNLGLDMEVIDTFNLSSVETSPVVVCVKNQEEKRLILQNKSKLKDTVNAEGKGFFINDHQTPEINETKVHQRQIFQANKRNVASRVDMSFVKGSLKIQNETYKSKVRVPQPSEFLQLTPQEYDQIMEIKLQQGVKVSEQGNMLVGFTRPVNSFQEINQAYMKMKLKYPQAKHIVCAFKIPGEEQYYCSDYCDDGDHAVGRKILELMNKNEVNCRVIFVARYTDGTKMGPRHYAAYLEAAKNAIEQQQYNHLTKTTQTIMQMTSQQRKFPTVQNARKKSVRTYAVLSEVSARRKILSTSYKFANPENPWNDNGPDTEDRESWGSTPTPTESWENGINEPMARKNTTMETATRN